MGDVDDVELAEGDREAERDRGIEAAEQQARDDGVEQQLHRAVSGRSAASTLSRLSPTSWPRCTGTELAGSPLLGQQHDPLAGLLELLEVAVLDVLELDHQHARGRPLAVLAELDRADDGVELGVADVVGELLLVEAADRLDRLAQDLHVGVGERRQVVAERIDALALGARLVLGRGTPGCPGKSSVGSGTQKS